MKLEKLFNQGVILSLFVIGILGCDVSKEKTFEDPPLIKDNTLTCKLFPLEEELSTNLLFKSHGNFSEATYKVYNNAQSFKELDTYFNKELPTVDFEKNSAIVLAMRPDSSSNDVRCLQVVELNASLEVRYNYSIKGNIATADTINQTYIYLINKIDSDKEVNFYENKLTTPIFTQSVEDTTTREDSNITADSNITSSTEDNATREDSNITVDSNITSSIADDTTRTVIDDSSLIRSNSALNSDLYLGLSKEGENLFYSSYSIFSALSMTYAGALNTTKKEFEQVLHFDENLSVDDSFALLLSKSSYEYNTFNIANSIWPQENFPFKQSYIDTVTKKYKSELYFKDYETNYEASRVDINTWVEDNTEKKIVDLIPKGALDSLTKMVLVNALYFKGVWEVEFDKNDTTKDTFYLADSSEQEVDMMHMKNSVKYDANSLYKMLELSYKENEFSMLIFLPNERDDMPELEELLFKTASPLMLRDTFYELEVEVSLPKFKIKWGTESLKNFLKSKGMIETFDSNLADLGAMWTRTPDENLYISDVVHQTFIEVNEEGAEAAAATAVIASGISGGGGSTNFTADHPFIFFIVDNKTGMTIFSGKLEDPSSI